jgi:hypothetical protein
MVLYTVRERLRRVAPHLDEQLLGRDRAAAAEREDRHVTSASVVAHRGPHIQLCTDVKSL